MNFFLICYLLHRAYCGLVRDIPPDELDANVELSEEAFEDLFEKTPITDPVELERHRQRLAEVEEEVKEINMEYLEGKKTWFEKIDEFSDLPLDEFLAERTGLIDGYARGLIDSDAADEMDPVSEKYFDTFRYSRSATPANYSSVDLGYVTGVKDQKTCESCVIFSTIAALEVCIKKLTGDEVDYSEQQLLDCGYGKYGANGCYRAQSHSYLQTLYNSRMGLAHESTYPYRGTRGTCRSVLDNYNRGAMVTGAHFSYQGDEDLMEKTVAELGAVSTSLAADSDDFITYKGGVYDGDCSNNRNHAVTVVGYGTTESGEKYWLIKNSWGRDWGEDGYMRLIRGVSKCGIAKTIVTVDCAKVDGPTSAPLTTSTPCADYYRACHNIVENKCHEYQEHCRWSCGLCEGMIPAASNTCYDEFDDCASLCFTSKAHRCKKSCGLCGLGGGKQTI